MSSRAKDWIEQAARDLDLAQEARSSGHHEWACFAAQQSAEKAVTALHLHLGKEAWGHVVAQLLLDLPSMKRPAQEMVWLYRRPASAASRTVPGD